MHIKGKGSALI